MKDIRGPVVLESRDSYIGSLRDSHEYRNVDIGLRQRRASHVEIPAAGKLSISGFKPANVSLASSVRKVTRDPLDSASFFFSFESDLPQSALELLIRRDSRSGRPVYP